MDSASFSFIAFGLLAAALSNCSKSPFWRTGVLVAASGLFLWLLNPQPLQILPFAGFLILGFLGLRMPRGGRSEVTAMIVILTVLAFAWLKKYSFLPNATFLAFPYFTLGLSYIFFRVLHLIIESGQRESEAARISLFAYVAYTLNFATLVSGPIQVYDEFAKDQFADEPPALDLFVIASQFERLIRGFFKVNVLAVLLNMVKLDSQARMTEQLPASTRMFSAILMLAGYALFLYANFSGYIDIVIALARLMRLRLPENFDRPFSATSFIEFWSRWHITLSNWLKTYVYNPLLMASMRRITSPSLEPFLGVMAFFVTFFLIGIWHGRTSEFALFGVLQGGGVAINKLWQIILTKNLGRKGYRRLAEKPLYLIFGRGLTFTWFAITLLWFWGDWGLLDRLIASLSVTQWLLVCVSLWLGASIVLAVWEQLRHWLLNLRVGEQSIFLNRYARTVYSTAMFVTSVVMVVLLSGAAPVVVYKAF